MDITLVCYDIWTKDGQTVIETIWTESEQTAQRIAYLLDGVAEKTLVGIVRPE